MSLPDLPDPILEAILRKLSPSTLCRVALVCHSMKQICFSDPIWEPHMKKKWGGLIHHERARRAWRSYTSARTASRTSEEERELGCCGGSLSILSFLSWFGPKLRSRNLDPPMSPPTTSSSVMKWYSALESGRFWLPAQVYNREGGHAGFLLSCYDADLHYDRQTNSFCAKYGPHGTEIAPIEEGIGWDRVRAPPVEISAHDIYISEGANELRPGDHVEIQWRRSRDFPFGWWYGEVGHVEPCTGQGNICHCLSSEKLVVEFKQYSAESLWKQTTLDRRDHSEEGDETGGFYGGIRRLQRAEVAAWRRLWPDKTLD